MAYQFKGEQICSQCGHKYEWVTLQTEKNEAVTGFTDGMWKNVKDCTRINQTNLYSIEIGSPKCGKREFVERERK